MSRSILAVAALCSFACAAQEQTTSGTELSAARAQLDSLWMRYAAAAVAGEVDAIAALYADSATLIESGLPTVRGRSQLRAVAGEVLGSVRILESDIRPQSTEVEGRLALQHGEYHDVLQPAGEGVQHTYGRFAAVLERDRVGQWRIRSLVAVLDSTAAQQQLPEAR